MQIAPIALFVYNRPRHVRYCIESLQKNFFADKSELFIFSDGAKDCGQEKNVRSVREYIRNIQGFKRLHIVEQPENKDWLRILFPELPIWSRNMVESLFWKMT